MNPFASQYRLTNGQSFATAKMLWSRSGEGKGPLSRNFHHWVLRYGTREGNKVRPVLLNNWEATYFNFNENRLVSLFDGAKELGAEIFLLDDGWFGNGKYARNNDRAGLGDWQVNTNKLPQGLSYLTAEAKKRGIGFGIWIEPEMVNPVSQLFETHPDWPVGQPHRDVILQRNQRVLDISRPETRDFSWGVIQGIMDAAPDIAYVKWDCNCYITQPGSTWLKPQDQSHLFIDYQHSLYNIMDRMSANHPNLRGMLCSGGAGRVDYESLKHFDSFWLSDNTDPAKRVFIQWGFSQFYPASTIIAHATRSGNHSIKFTFDVAMSGALGMDMDVGKLTPEQHKDAAASVAVYKERVRDVVQLGDLYRLESPYDGPRAAMDFVSADRARAILFIYQLKDADAKTVKPRGLDPRRIYRLTELNLPDGATPTPAFNGKDTFDGETLMRDGFLPPCDKAFTSAVIELAEVK